MSPEVSEAPTAKHHDSSLAQIVGGIVRDIREVLPPGDVAELRRMRPDDAGCAAYWKLLSTRVEDSSTLNDLMERRWAVILASLARLAPQHRSDARLGRALAEADVAEKRVLRLLRAHDEALEDAVRVVTHQLASAGVPLDATALAWLVLSDGRPDETRARRSIARDYYSRSPRA